jgi:hypothetical protein
LSTQELAFRGNDESVHSDNEGNFKELAKFAATLDEHLNKFIDPSLSRVFTELSKTIQNDLIDSVTNILMKTIYDEINSAVLRKLYCLFFYTIPADSLNIYFILLFSFSKCPLLLIKVDFDWNFALNKYSLYTCLLTNKKLN